MEPDVSTPGAGTDPGAGSDGPRAATFDRWLAVQQLTVDPRPELIADVIGHPKSMPSVEELAYMNPDLSEDAIRRHLKTLAEVGVLVEREIPPGDRLRDFPWKFYALSEPARALFDENGWFPEAAWTRQYAAVEKTDRIRDVEEMPRPGE